MKRIGLVVPSSNTTMESDYMKRFPFDKATLHIARMYLADTNRDSEERMMGTYLSQAIKDLGSADVDVIMFGCTSAGTLHGSDSEDELKGEINLNAGAQGVTVTETVVSELHDVNAHTIALFTPYIEDLQNSTKEWLERVGFSVPISKGMDSLRNLDTGRILPEKICDFAIDALNECDSIVDIGNGKYQLKDIDAIFFSCTNLLAWDALDIIREKIDCNYVTSNQALLNYTIKKFI